MNFHYMPAGIKLRAYAGLTVYTKYLPYSYSRGFQVKTQSRHHYNVVTPDRELFICDSVYSQNGLHPEV